MRPIPGLALALAVVAAAGCHSRAVDVRVARVPHGGLQPEIAVAPDGVLHLVYLAGEPSAADVFYVRSTDGGRSFSPPLQVNSQPGSAIATGTVRGAQVALGRDGVVHVAWNGSASASPPPPPGTPATSMNPMLYARLPAGAGRFEPQRSLITHTADLDGGGALAADAAGTVYVAWHGRDRGEPGGEDHRRLWIAQSADDGGTFAPERAAAAPAGVCGCCAVRMAVTPSGELHLLYRTATGGVHRDVHALVSRDGAQSFTDSTLGRWDIGACPMTSMAIAGLDPPVYGWETDGEVFYRPAAATVATSPPPSSNGEAARRTHPRLAVDVSGSTLMAWTEGTAWARGGSVSWRLFDPDGRPTSTTGTRSGSPAWSFAAVAALADGGFVLFY